MARSCPVRDRVVSSATTVAARPPPWATIFARAEVSRSTALKIGYRVTSNLVT